MIRPPEGSRQPAAPFGGETAGQGPILGAGGLTCLVAKGPHGMDTSVSQSEALSLPSPPLQ
jgi:hypothetical protein